MILSDDDVKERMESPLNLMNRLRKVTKTIIPSLPSPVPPKSTDIIDSLDDKLKVGGIRAKAAAIMSDALDELKIRIPSVEKPEKLAAIASEMNKVLISRQEQEKSEAAQIIVYAPQVLNESHFETITVNE